MYSDCSAVEPVGGVMIPAVACLTVTWVAVIDIGHSIFRSLWFELPLMVSVVAKMACQS